MSFRKLIVSFIKKVALVFGYHFSLKRREKFHDLLSKPRYTPIKIHMNGSSFIVHDPPSFYHSYHEIFSEQIYKFDTTKTSPFIIDCGSNCGTSIAYFKHLYPQSKIVGFEADPKIFEVAKQNVLNMGLEDVELHNLAVWDKEEVLTFDSEGSDAGRVARGVANESSLIEVQAKSLVPFLEGKEVDMLKIDIEGAEVEVFEDIQDHLAHVNNIFVEFHSFDKKPQKFSRLISILEKNGFRYYIQTQFCSPQPLIKRDLQIGMDLQLNIFATRVSV